MTDGPGAPRGGMSEALSRLAASAVDLLRTRVELATVDFDEARELAKDRLALLVGGVVCLAVGTLGASAFVVVYFWDTYRLAALGAVTLAYFVVGALALWRFSVRQRTDPTPFAATLAELERDRRWLAGERGEGK
jgi:uncharacterized membrane protein YqjE